MGFVVPSRFCGPPESGNGGWVSGHVAALLRPGAEESVTVRLRTPPPLDRELTVATGEGTAGARSRSPTASTRSRRRRPAPPWSRPAYPRRCRSPTPRRPASGYEGLEDHPFPTCFSCGTAREPGDGLRLQPGRVAGGDGEYAAAWVPAADVDLETVWAALDCPGGWASGHRRATDGAGHHDRPGRQLPAVGAEHVVMAWQRGGEGRKHHSGTALYAADGRLLAQAEATWIAIDPKHQFDPQEDAHEQARRGDRSQQRHRGGDRPPARR